MEDNANESKVVIISATDSFLAKSLMTKLEGNNIATAFAHATIDEIKANADSMELIILFLSDELDDCSDALVYLNDNIMERDLGLIVIGDKLQYERVTDIIHEQGITEFVERPLDIEKLIKSVAQYMEENTGEKRKKTVLIVDDDITYMRTIYEWLKGSYHVGMASSGLQAISYLTKNKADLVLLDYEMPIADGPQVLSMLKSDSETDQIPVMFLTGKSDAQSVLAVVNLKPVDYLLKTIDKPGLLGKLDAFFKSRALNM